MSQNPPAENWLIECVGVKWHVNPCGSFCAVSQRKGEKEEIVDEVKERDREVKETEMKVIKTVPLYPYLLQG